MSHEKISDATHVPFLKGAIGTTILIGQTVQRAKHNKDACYEIGDRINNLILGIYSQLAEGGSHMDGSLQERVTSLENHLMQAHQSVQKLAARNIVRRIVSHMTDEEEIRAIERGIDNASKLFEVKNQIAVAMDVKYLRDENVRKRVTEGSGYGAWTASARCFPGTRLRYIDEILRWSSDIDSPSVCWLTGVAGSGKSSIAHEIAFRHHEERRMYSCFFFKRDDSSISSSAIQLLAFGLTHYSTTLRNAISHAMERLHDLRVTPTFSQQFESFLVTPLRDFCASNTKTPITLIIDALDECPPSIRPEMMHALQIGGSMLPRNVKLFLTSRPQRDISVHLEELASKGIHIKVGLDQDQGDLERYIKHELTQIRTLSRLQASWSDHAIASDALALANKACGLFQWAAVACSLIRKRFSPRDAIGRILALQANVDAQVNLDTLYSEGLRLVFPDAEGDPELRNVYVQVVGAIIGAKEPLGISAISDLVELEEDVVDRLLIDLGCVISVESERGTRVAHIAHPSFYDFITTSNRCTSSIFYLNSTEVSRNLGLQSLSLCLRRLKRDICEIRDPRVDNDDISQKDLDRLLPEGLRYSCRFAFAHVMDDSAFSSGILHALDAFVDTKLLEWMEVMSYLQLLDTAATIIRDFLAMKYAVGDFPEQHEHRQEMLRDALRFLGLFGTVISRSALHIYFSALPFTPRNTLLYCVYSSKYTGLIKVTQGYNTSWPSELLTIRRPAARYGLGSLVFSADSSRILEIGDKIRLFSVFTGAEISSGFSKADITLEKFFYLPDDSQTSPEHKPSAEENTGLILPFPTFGVCGLFHIITAGLPDRQTSQTRFLVAPLLPNPQHQEVTCPTMSKISSMTFDGLGRIFFVGFEDGTVRAWDPLTWEEVHCNIPSHPKAVLVLQSSGSMLASMSSMELHILNNERNLQWNRLRSIPGGRRLAFVAISAGEWSCTVLLDADDDCHLCLDSSRAGSSMILPVNPLLHAFTPDAKSLVCVETLELATLWDSTSGIQIAKCILPGLELDGRSHLSEVSVLPVHGELQGFGLLAAISRNGELLAVASNSGIKLHKLVFKPKKETHSQPPITGLNVISVVSSGENRFVTGHRDGFITAWDATTAKPSNTLHMDIDFHPINRFVRSLSTSDDGKVVAVFLSLPKWPTELTLQVTNGTNIVSNWELRAANGFIGPILSPSASRIAALTLWTTQPILFVFDLFGAYACLSFSLKTNDSAENLKLIFSPNDKLLASFGYCSFTIYHLEHKNECHSSWHRQERLEYAFARFSPDSSKFVHVVPGAVTVWAFQDVDESWQQCFMFDFSPLLPIVLFQDVKEGWVYDIQGRRLWWIPSPFRAHVESSVYSEKVRAPTQSSVDGCLALVTSEESLVVVDAKAMLSGLSHINIETRKPRLTEVDH